MSTSLPEIATTVTAAASGQPRLAVNNLLGGIAAQTAILVVADVLAPRPGALTFFTPSPVLLLQGTLLILLLALATTAMAVGEIATVAGVGLWPLLLAAAYVGAMFSAYRYEGRPAWRPTTPVDDAPAPARGDVDRGVSTRAVLIRYAVTSGVVLVSGWLLARVGGALADQTGLGAGFVGATLVAVSTSLPELSTTISAARHGAYDMAISNIFGSNALMVGLLLVADVFNPGGPILGATDRAALVSASLGIAVTAVYLWGLIERSDRAVLRMGMDSIAVGILYLVGLWLLYRVR